MKSYRIEASYIDQDFLDRCLAEFHQVAIRKNLGQDANALEKLAINVLEKFIVEKFNLKKDR